MPVVNIDVEKLLRWAYRDEIDKQIEGGVTSWEHMIYLGTTVDERPRDYKLPLALGPPHPDAVTIDAHVKGYGVEHIDWPGDRDYLIPELGPDYLADDEPKLAGERSSRKRLAKDDKAERYLIRGLQINAGDLVIKHARLGNRPIWDCGPVKLRRILGKNGKPIVDGVTPGRRYAVGAACPVRLDPPAYEVAAARWEYALWRYMLCRIAEDSQGWGLTAYRALPPAAAERPWVCDDEPRVRLIPDLSPPGPKTYGRPPIYASAPPKRSGRPLRTEEV